MDGIGEKTITRLLQKFKTVSKIRKASVTELAEEIGLVKAQIVKESLHKNEKGTK